jgi:hypothetical protein
MPNTLMISGEWWFPNMNSSVFKIFMAKQPHHDKEQVYHIKNL